MALIPNPLEDFATYNALWTFACISPAQLTDLSYRSSLKNIIFSSAGRFDGDRVQTAYGAPEYFVDNVEMRAVITPTPSQGNANSVSTNFEIFEPYSLGLFLQSCQAAALEAGYKSYLDNAAYVLKLEFKGQKTTGQFGTVGPFFFPVRLKTVDFTVTEAGSKYRVTTVPFNQQVFNASSNTVFNDMKLIGKTAKEVLVDHPTNSLVAQLNSREKMLVDDKKRDIPDKYTIEFVPCDWGGPNPFEPTKGGDLEYAPTSTGGTEVFKRQGDVDGGDGKVIRGKMTINPKEKTLMFSQGTSIANVIDYVILSTKEARENATNPGKMVDGFVTWWRISTDIKLIALDTKIKDHAKEYIFRIVPYRIHHSVFMGPETKAQGVPKIKANLAKEYNYIYTGLNTDVLKFNIEIKNLFFTAVDPNKPEDTAVQASPSTQAKLPPEAPKAEGSEGQTAPATGGNAPSVKPSLFAGRLPFNAGSGQVDSKQKIANEFYMNALTKAKDTINLDIELMGDPYWLPENGQGNFHPSGGGTPVANGTMNHENLDIYVGVTFRTPIDQLGSKGLYVFQDAGMRSPFSGIYKVVEANHKFSGGTYKVTLKGPRMPAQDIEGGLTGDVFPTKLGEVPKEQTTVAMKPKE